MRLGFKLGLCLSIQRVLVYGSFNIRGNNRGMSASSHISAFHVAPDGHRDEIAGSDEEKVKQVLCSRQVLSHLQRCPEDDSGEAGESPYKERLYPMNAAYRKAVEQGYACPLPAPFMHVSVKDSSCCIPSRDANVWPNFCEDIEELGKPLGHGPVKWELGADIAVKIPENHYGAHQKHLPAGVYRLGIPDVPTNYDKESTSIYLIATYFVMSGICFGLLVAVFNRIEEEHQIAKGKQREEVFARSQARFIDDDDENDEASPVSSAGSGSSVSPARDRIAREPEESLVGPVSLSFGLLPPLPRGRSTNPSSLNSPRLTARG